MRTGYLVQMIPTVLASANRGLRLLALAVLVLGLLGKPVLIAGCELEDLGAAGTAVATMVADDAGSQDGDTCCQGQSCGECCSVASAMPAGPAQEPMIPSSPIPLARIHSQAEPASLPVAQRPPITG